MPQKKNVLDHELLFWKSVKSPRFRILLAASILFKINPNLIQRNLK